MLIFSSRLTPRVIYAFNLLLKQILFYAAPLQFTDNIKDFEAENDSKIQYGGNKITTTPTAIYMPATGLLFETDIRAIQPDISYWHDTPIFFCVKSDTDDIPFDMAAAAFFLASRYEEYWPLPSDTHGRFQAENSWAFRFNFLKLPLIDIWANILKNKLLESNSALVFGEKKYSFLPTFDIDNAYAFQYKGLKRTLLASASDLLYGRWRNNWKRWITLAGFRKDPFDTYQKIDQIHEKNGNKPLIFWLLGNYSPFDKNISHEQPAFRKLIQEIAQKYRVGIHPSYISEGKIQQIATEKKRLEVIINQEITFSRQHYLKMTMPKTYQHLLAVGLRADYTMGYGSQLGFRAGTCTPFDWYDLENEQHTALKIYPFALMDVTLRHYLKLSPDEALKETRKLISITKSVNGIFCSLMHNEILSDENEWKSWLSFYENLVEAAKSQNKLSNM